MEDLDKMAIAAAEGKLAWREIGFAEEAAEIEDYSAGCSELLEDNYLASNVG